MDFVSAVRQGLRNALDFKGRASRSEFWWFAAFVALCEVPLRIAVLAMTSWSAEHPAWLFAHPAFDTLTAIVRVFYLLLLLALAVPHLAITVRRLHDVDQSGWLVIALLVMYTGRPFVQQIYILGGLWLVILACAAILQLVMLVSRGSEGDNSYGPPPQTVAAAAVLP
jgi:uncharacterized membrane protein YhaH (DUF805 family)